MGGDGGLALSITFGKNLRRFGYALQGCPLFAEIPENAVRDHWKFPEIKARSFQ